MIPRRSFLYSLAPAVLRGASMTMRERVDRAIEGRDVDRPPYTAWYHFLDENKPAEHHARMTLEFHRKFSTDLVKVMSDYAYPKPAGKWYEVKALDNPFPTQIKALELIRAGLKGEAHFLETIFNPWNVATKLSSKEEVMRMKSESPQRLLDALSVIAKSEASHAKKAIAAGASGVFLAIDNAQTGILAPEEYRKFSEPFDRMVVDAAKDAPLTTLHLHGDKVYVDYFLKGWPVRGINYALHGTGVPLSTARASFPGVLLGGLDEVNFRKLTEARMRSQIDSARKQAGKKWILAPGCSVPNDTADAEILRLRMVLG